MKYDSIIHRRRSIRLSGFDYSQPGCYFITICTYQKRCLFGKIVNNEIMLNQFGQVVEKEWLNSEKIRKNIIIDKYVIMPNHLHGIIIINHGRGISQSNCTNNINPNRRGVSRYAPTTDNPKPDVSRYAPTTDNPKPDVSQYAPTTDNPKPDVSQYAPSSNNNFGEHIFSEIQNKFHSPSQTIGSIIRGFKSTTAKQINLMLNAPGAPVWQRNFYEHIIRDEDDYYRIAEYIRSNPEKWESDRNYSKS